MLEPAGPGSNASMFKRVSGAISLKDTTNSFAVPTGRCATVVVAASDSANKEAADYICPSTAVETMIQTAVNITGDIYFMDGSYSKSSVAPITIPSDTHLHLAANAEIKFIDDVGDGAVIFANSGLGAAGNDNIQIIGGIIDGNVSGQSAGTQHGIHFEDVSNCKVDCIVQNFNGCNFKTDESETGKSGITFINRLYPNLLPNLVNPDMIAANHPAVFPIHDFESDWTVIDGTIAYDTDIKHSGTRSLRMTTPEGGQATVDLEFSPTLDLSKSGLLYWLRMSDASDVLTMHIYTRSGGSSWANYQYGQVSHYKGLSNVDGEWVRVGMAEFDDSVNGNPDLQEIDLIRIRVIAAAGKTPTIWIDDLVDVKNIVHPNGIVTICYDDGDISTFTKAKPLHDKYHFPGVAAITTHFVHDGAEIAQAAACGWDMVCHSKSHIYAPPSGHYDADECEGFWEDQMLSSQSYLNEKGWGAGSKYYVFPSGTNNAKILKIIQKYFTGGRLAIPYGLNSIPAGTFHTGMGITSSTSPADVCAAIDDAVRTGMWLQLYFHVIVDSGATGTEYNKADLETILDYCDEVGIDVITYSKAHEMLMNPVSRSQYTDLFMDVLAVSATHVRSNEDLSAGTPITFALDAQPDVPRTLSWSFDSHAQISAYDMEVIGTDASGKTITETWDESDGWSGETNNAFATITSIKMTSRTGTGVADTMDIGITDVLGLSNEIFYISDIFKIKKNNANATVATAQVNTKYSTYDMGTIGLGAADDFTIWYTTVSLVGQ